MPRVLHAWSVLCDRVIIDSDTNNVSLDVIEQLLFSVPGGDSSKKVVIPMRMEVVSLWFREHPDQASSCLVRVKLKDPSGAVLTSTSIPVDLQSKRRYRTRLKLDALPVTTDGVYLFEIEQETKGSWATVASLPLEVLRRAE